MRIAKAMLIPAILLVVAAAGLVNADPLQKRINFSVSVPYTMRMANYELPAGDYILYQIDSNNLNLFALYMGDSMTHSPIAMIQTTRIDYTGRWPEHTRMHLRYDESNDQAEPVITGWNIPGDDGWQIISVVPSKHSVLTRVR